MEGKQQINDQTYTSIYKTINNDYESFKSVNSSKHPRSDNGIKVFTKNISNKKFERLNKVNKDRK
jgi:hypothetical protein